jgi:hypothetical protein
VESRQIGHPDLGWVRFAKGYGSARHLRHFAGTALESSTGGLESEGPTLMEVQL